MPDNLAHWIEADAPAVEPTLDALSRLAVSCGTDKWGAHLYTPFYHRLFSHLRERPLRLLEIGVGGYRHPRAGGRSLLMWAEYFPHAQVTGLDLHPKRLDLGPNVKIYQGRQNDSSLLSQIHAERGPFDIIIDDGSHLVNDVLSSFEILFPLLTNDGFYAIEDVQAAFWPEYGGNPRGAGTILQRVHALILAMHAEEVAAAGGQPEETKWGDIINGIHAFRNLIVIERGCNDHPSNARFDHRRASFQRVWQVLDVEAARFPSLGAIMIKAQMLQLAGQYHHALAVAAAGLSQYPRSPDLIAAMLNLAKTLKRDSEVRLLQDRLDQLNAEGSEGNYSTEL